MRRPPIDLIDLVRERGGVDLGHCYQCGKCSAGCPMAHELPHAPNLLARLLQLRDPACDEEVLRSATPWLCASCLTCSSRCPQEVDLARAMDTLREIALERRTVPEEVRSIAGFHRAFLDTIESRGRLHELHLIARYKLANGGLLADADKALPMLLRGKLRLRGPAVRDMAGLSGIFERARRRPSPNPAEAPLERVPGPSEE